MSTSMPVMPRPQARLGTRLGNWLLGTNAALVFGFIYLPVVILIIFSFNNPYRPMPNAAPTDMARV